MRKIKTGQSVDFTWSALALVAIISVTRFAAQRHLWLHNLEAPQGCPLLREHQRGLSD
jgi:hypothetical protein